MKRIKTPTIVQPNGRKLPLMLLTLLLLIVVLVWLSWLVFSYGQVQGGFEREQVAQQSSRYLQQIDEQQQELGELRVQTARHKREAQIEHEAGRRLQQQLIQLHKNTEELKNEVALLRSLMSSNSGSLYIKRFQVYSTETAGKYRYQLIVAQALDNVGTTKGKLIISLVGKQGGKASRLKLEQFSEDAAASIALEFKHYQDVNGVIDLPEGFMPESVELEIQPKNSKLSKMNKQFAWKVIDADNRGQEQADAGA